MGWAQLGRTAANFLTLVACMTDADASPFDQQVATHRDYLLRFARLQLRNETWAEDAVSETLLAALSKPLSFANRSQLKTWLVGILKHKIIDALRHRPDAFVAAGKRTKNFWLLVLGVATALGFVTSVLSMFGVVAFVAAAVYLVDVRPALAQVSGRGGGRQGPYGPW